MDRKDLTELHYIASIDNLASIMELGLLSHIRVKDIAHSDVSLPEVQAKRAKKQVPGGLMLHEYVNLYMNARNPMMYRIVKSTTDHKKLCVLRVSVEVLDLNNVVIADGNSASDYIKFQPSPVGLDDLDKSYIFTDSWNDPDRIEKFKRATKICAEVLVPNVVSSDYILGMYVSCEETKKLIESKVADLDIQILPKMFFQ